MFGPVGDQPPTQLQRLMRNWLTWAILFVLSTVFMIGLRDHVDNATSAFIYLLIVLGASVGVGRGFGVVIACVGFLGIDFYFQPPYQEFTIAKPHDWIVLVGYLTVCAVATQLLAVARAEAERAHQRAVEIERLSIEVGHAEALREANRLKDILLASVSHDLRTPLTTIKALAQGISARGDANAGIIVEQAERLARMVSDLLDLSRLKGGAFPIEREINTAEDVIGAVKRQYAGVHGAERIHADVDYSRPALLGSFDFVHAVRILGNLVDNALRHGPSGTPVDIRVTGTEDWLIFTVEDQGPGVALEDRDGLFESFRVGRNAIPDAGRAGLGLSIAHRLAQMQGGDLNYVDRPEGGGTFVVRFPRATLPITEHAVDDIGDDSSVAVRVAASRPVG